MVITKQSLRLVAVVATFALAWCVGVGVFFVPQKPAEAAFPGSNGKIYFGHNGSVWAMNPDGTGQTELLGNNDSNAENNPAVSPDGAQIAYVFANPNTTESPKPTPPDTTPPSVTSTAPIANVTEVAPSANVMATFSEPMQPASVQSAFKLFKQGSATKLSAVDTYDAVTKKATLNPSANLRLGTIYKAVVSTEAKDVAGNPLDQNSSLSGLQQKAWTFTIRK